MYEIHSPEVTRYILFFQICSHGRVSIQINLVKSFKSIAWQIIQICAWVKSIWPLSICQMSQFVCVEGNWANPEPN